MTDNSRFRFDTLTGNEKAAVGHIWTVAWQYGVERRLGYHSSVAAVVLDSLMRVGETRRPLVLAHAAARVVDDREAYGFLIACGARNRLVAKVTAANPTPRARATRPDRRRTMRLPAADRRRMSYRPATLAG